MADPATFSGDVIILGTLVCNRQVVPASAIGDSQVIAGAGISASKLQHQYEVPFAQRSDFDAEPGTWFVHRVWGATGTIVGIRAWAVVPAGAATTCTVDVLVNGVSVLTAPIQLTNAQAAYEDVTGSIATAGLVAGDKIEVVIAGTGVNEPQGVGCSIMIRSDAN